MEPPVTCLKEAGSPPGFQTSERPAMLSRAAFFGDPGTQQALENPGEQEEQVAGNQHGHGERQHHAIRRFRTVAICRPEPFATAITEIEGEKQRPASPQNPEIASRQNWCALGDPSERLFSVAPASTCMYFYRESLAPCAEATI
jgi:hypothetical protein